MLALFNGAIFNGALFTAPFLKDTVLNVLSAWKPMQNFLQHISGDMTIFWCLTYVFRMYKHKGPSIYDVHKKITFLTPLPPLHLPPHGAGPPPPPRAAPHRPQEKQTPPFKKHE